jgi:hypothetical protein
MAQHGGVPVGDKSPKNTNKTKMQKSQKKGLKPASAPMKPSKAPVKK